MRPVGYARERLLPGVEPMLGDVRSLHADRTQRLPSDPAHRLNNPDLAGGCLLDVGVYPVSFAHDILGDPVEVTGRGTLSDTGVDVCVATALRHRNDALSTSYSSMETRGPTPPWCSGPRAGSRSTRSGTSPRW
ncbi:hypothetical protein ABGB14_05280 [Nonomuraea sp. B10E15]|uniref:Gfo/Idh/MocA family protein n=1 Tax=Nonomuraea sp. B10E15 TaxID=3153560 RepID=UPI00325F1407